MDLLRIYFKLIKISMHGKMQYKADFFAGIVGVIIYNVVNLSLIGILLSRFSNLNGWNLWEIVFIYCLWVLCHSLYSTLFWHFYAMEEYIVQGTFDQFLIRPLSPLLQYLGREIQYMGFADLTIGIAGISLAYGKLGLCWGAGKWGFFVLAIISGAIIETCLMWITASITFWKGRTFSLVSIVTQFGVMAEQYPIDIFGKWFKVIVTGFIPVAFMNYYPSLWLLGKTDTGNPGWISFLSPAVACVLLAVAGSIWVKGIKSYSSTGS